MPEESFFDKSKLLFWLAIVAVIFGSLYFFFYMNKSEYLILGVPHYTVYDYADKERYFSNTTDSSIYSLLDYWEADASTYIKTFDIKPNEKGFITLESVAKFFKDIGGFETTLDWISLDEAGKYISEAKKTPILVAIPLTDDYSLHMTSVLIGIDEKRGVLTVHNYWYGNNYEIPIKDVFVSSSRFGEGKTLALVVRPENAEEVLSKKGEDRPYRPFTPYMDKNVPIFKNYYLGSLYSLDRNTIPESITHLLAVESDLNFESYFPPTFKVFTWNLLAINYLSLGDLERSETYLGKAFSMNKNLDQPFGSWPGMPERRNSVGNEGVVAGPYTTRGFIFKAKGDIANARDSFVEARRISPWSSRLDELINSL